MATRSISPRSMASASRVASVALGLPPRGSHPRPLSASEMETMRAHPLFGDHIIKPVRLLSTISAAVRNHHEWWDGTGYPDQLKGEAIPLLARIIAIADTWDACTSTRPYQVALSEEEALAVIDRLNGRHLDPSLVPPLKQVIADRKSGSRQRPESVKKAG